MGTQTRDVQCRSFVNGGHGWIHPLCIQITELAHFVWHPVLTSLPRDSDGEGSGPMRSVGNPPRDSFFAVDVCIFLGHGD